MTLSVIIIENISVAIIAYSLPTSFSGINTESANATPIIPDKMIVPIQPAAKDIPSDVTIVPAKIYAPNITSWPCAKLSSAHEL